MIYSWVRTDNVNTHHPMFVDKPGESVVMTLLPTASDRRSKHAQHPRFAMRGVTKLMRLKARVRVCLGRSIIVA
jgi:hypothetical protein